MFWGKAIIRKQHFSNGFVPAGAQAIGINARGEMGDVNDDEIGAGARRAVERRRACLSLIWNSTTNTIKKP